MFRRCFGFFWTLFSVRDDEVNLGQDGHSEESVETNGGWSMERLLFRNSNPELIELVSEEPINPEKIKKYIEEHPEHIHDIADKGKDNVLHRITQRIEEHSPELSEKHKELLKSLLEKGAKVESRDISGDTPLHVAARLNKYKTIQLFIERVGNTKNTLLGIKNNDGETCLHVAVENASVEVCAILHRYGDYLDETKRNGQDFTAEDIASKLKYNDNTKAMEKISEIFHTDRETYENEKLYLKYLHHTPEGDALWSLRPIINIHAGDNTVVAFESTVNINKNIESDDVVNVNREVQCDDTKKA